MNTLNIPEHTLKVTSEKWASRYENRGKYKEPQRKLIAEFIAEIDQLRAEYRIESYT